MNNRGMRRTLIGMVVSDKLAALVDLPWEHLGRHRLRGVAEEVQAFSPPP